MDELLKNGYYSSNLDEINVDWFLPEVIKLEIKLNFNFENIEKDIITTEEDEADFKRLIITLDFVRKNF